MAITTNIERARARGASDEQIVREIMKQNPDKQANIMEAYNRGADSSMILNEIMSQNQTVGATDVPKSDNMQFAKKLVEADKSILGFGIDIKRGVEKGFKRTLAKTSELGERFIRSAGRVITPESMEKSLGFEDVNKTAAQSLIPSEVYTPTNIGEKIGMVAETIGEFFVPSGIVNRANLGLRTTTAGLKGATQLSARILGRAAIEGGAIAGVTALQEGELNKKVKTAAVVGAILGGSFEAIRALKTFLAKGLEKNIPSVVDRIIKPNKSVRSQGYDARNIVKYKIAEPGAGSDLGTMAVKTQLKMTELTDDLYRRLQESNQAGRTINLKEVASKTEQELLKSDKTGLLFGDRRAIKNYIDNELAQEIIEFVPDGNVNMLQAQAVKQGSGLKGAWYEGLPDKDASAAAKVYTKFYNVLKTEIERKSPAGVKDINRQLSDLIPLYNAIMHRAAVAGNSNLLGLTDNIAAVGTLIDPKNALVLGINRLSKSDKFIGILLSMQRHLMNAGTNPYFTRILF